MSGATAGYNERSWAIDLIIYLNELAQQNNRSIKGAGGEQTIKAEGRTLFPDVLLFGDPRTASILQGWELKMPDTDISDPEFRANAETKARALKLDSFILWNVSHAHLYTCNADTNEYILSHRWSDLKDITTRTAVARNRQRWEKLASQIFDYLNDCFDNGSLEGRPFIEAYREGGITALIMENVEQVAEALRDAARRDETLRDEMTLWWSRYGTEYVGRKKEQVLSQAVIFNWIGKILFSHILREKDQRAVRVDGITENTTPSEALELFKQLSEDCNFWTIFSSSLGLDVIPDSVWFQIKQFNSLLSDLRLGSLEQGELSGALEGTVEVALRKLRGQYSTPIGLARLLVHLCVRNIEDDRVLDPCCGSGTIARAALEQKLASQVSADRAAAAVFAGDQDFQAVQITTFALAKPDLMYIPLRIFQRDAFTLAPEEKLEFRNPNDGSVFIEALGKFQAIISNLPFVAQDGRKQYADNLKSVAESMEVNLGGRADVAAYLPFALHPLLANGGRLGIIITNAWLGTDWGDRFYNSLGRVYTLKSVITSGSGRWFQNSEVVTNILVMEKKVDSSMRSGNVDFVVLKRPLEKMADDEAVQKAAAQIKLGQTQNDMMTIRSVSLARLACFRKYGLGGNAQFVNCDWVLTLTQRLKPLKNVFTIRRGERRGKNKLFYPEPGHKIEREYIKPLVKSPGDFLRLTAKPAKEAFSCSRTEEELRSLGHTGALEWIRGFKNDENIEKLGGNKRLWYYMKTDTLADLVMFINYGDRLFVPRVDPPAFVDQRLVRLQPQGAVDIGLYHALLNSTISMFMIEGMGFGRGLGALDLNKDRIENYMHILDPGNLDQAAIKAIKTAFEPLLQREVLKVADELKQSDRQAFDDTVIATFGLHVDRERIYDSLLSLVEIRLTATH